MRTKLATIRNIPQDIPTACMLYITIWDYVSQGNRPAVLVRANNILLLRYSLDARVSYSAYYLIFKSQKGSGEALNFLIITSITS